MKNQILILLVLVSSAFSSQDCKHNLDTPLRDIDQTSSGDFVFISEDFKITKVDSNFDTIWHNNHMDTANNYLSQIHPTFDGGFIGTGSSPAGNLFKLNNFGDTVWTNQFQIFSGPFGGFGITNMIQTADSGYAFLAIYGHMSFYSMLVKMNRFGDTLWKKMNLLSATNTWDSQAKTLHETDNGDLIISGLVNVSFPTYSQYSYIYKLNSNGDSIWAKTYDDFQFNSVTIDDSENLIISGGKYDNSNIIEPRIIKANSLGDTLWTKPFQVDALKYGLIANDGGYVFGGRKDSSSYLLKTNTNGDSLWSRVFLEDTSIKEVKTIFKLNNNGFLLLGNEATSFTFGPTQMDYRIKVDSLGYCLGQNTTNFNNITNKHSFSIFPNPTQNQVTVKGIKKTFRANLFDIVGNRLLTTETNIISLENYPNGIYFLQISNEGRIEDFKIIKQ
jgi:hypothetical protein